MSPWHSLVLSEFWMWHCLVWCVCLWCKCTNTHPIQDILPSRDSFNYTYVTRRRQTGYGLGQKWRSDSTIFALNIYILRNVFYPSNLRALSLIVLAVLKQLFQYAQSICVCDCYAYLCSPCQLGWNFPISNTCDPQSMIDCDPNRSTAPETFYEKGHCTEVLSSLLVFFGWCCHSISCAAFSARSLSLQILRNFSRRYSVLMLLSLSSVTNLILLLGLCAACMLLYMCLQTEWCHGSGQS